MIRRCTKSEIADCQFHPEPHTTWFGYDGDWWCYEYGGRIVACIVVRNVRNKNVVAGVYTLPEYRRRGIMHQLIDYVTNVAYAGQDMYAHCLISSKRVFEDCGYVHYRTTPYPHGAQYSCRRLNNGGSTKA